MTEPLEQDVTFPVVIDLHDNGGIQVFKDTAALVKAQENATRFIRQLIRERKQQEETIAAATHLLEQLSKVQRLPPATRDMLELVIAELHYSKEMSG